MERIASFCVDHTRLERGMYLSRQDGDVLTWDIRMKKPNQGDYLTTAAAHTLEHLFATYARNSAVKDGVIYVGPMGCRTGFYLLTRGLTPAQALQLTVDAYRFMADFEGAVPGASEVECGNYRDMDLPAAKAEAAAMLPVLEARDATYGSLKMIERWSFTHRDAGPLNSEAARWRKAMEDGMTMSPLAEYKGEPLYKIVYIAERSEDLNEAKRLYEDRFVFCESKLDGLNGGYVNGELINRKFDKGRGIKAVCDYLGVPLQNSIGFGDSDNDLQMTDVVGISVCMADGSASLKQRCDRIAPSVYEDGIAKEFAALGLI